MKYMVMVDNILYIIKSKKQAMTLYDHLGFEVAKIVLEKKETDKFWKVIKCHENKKVKKE